MWQTFLILLSLVACYVASLYWKFQQQKKKLPHPPASFLLGNTLDLHRGFAQETRFQDYIDWSVKYGKVYQLFLPFGKPIIQISDADTVKYILHTKNFPKEPAIMKMFALFVGDSGLFSILDELLWKQQRKALNPAFSISHIKHQLPIMERNTRILMQKLMKAQESGSALDMDRQFTYLTLDIIGESAFGETFQAVTKEENTQVLQALNGILNELIKCVMLPIRLTVPVLPATRQMLRNIDTMKKMTKDMIDRSQMRIGEVDDKSILSLMLKSGQTEDQLVSNAITFLVAGHDTTAHAMSCTLYELTENPDVYAKVMEEVDGVLGDSEFCNPDDLGKLVYLTKTIKETMRLHPPGLGTSRVATETFTINGTTIEEGSTLYIWNWPLHYDADLWPNPTKFDPERFSSGNPTEKSEKNPNANWVPFGIGARDCIGKTFAMMEAQFVLSALLKKIEFKQAPGYKFKQLADMTLTMKGGVQLTMHARQHSDHA